MPIKLVLVDQQPIYLLGLQHLLSGYPDFEIVAICQNGKSALEAVRHHQPDIVLTEYRLPDQTGLTLAQEIQRNAWLTRIVLLTDSLSDNEVLEIIRQAVHGFIYKNIPPNQLIQCLHKVHEGEIWLERKTTNLALSELLKQETQKQRSHAEITTRELQLVKLAAEGNDNKSIAEQLGISEGAVKIHLQRIYDKFDIDNRQALNSLAKEKGWI